MHYVKLFSASPFRAEFVYVDAPDYVADKLFIKHKVAVKFKDQMRRPGDPYVIVFCSVRKKDIGKFTAAIDELPEEMRQYGYEDYMEYCNKYEEAVGSVKHD